MKTSRGNTCCITVFNRAWVKRNHKQRINYPKLRVECYSFLFSVSSAIALLWICQISCSLEVSHSRRLKQDYPKMTVHLTPVL
uniref:Uncharacterized protein n=1 Tax=Pararge aegeria TaxID=116150 RepID=S4P2C7_9NEOP